MPKPNELFGATLGYQKDRGTFLGAQFPAAPDAPRRSPLPSHEKAYHGSSVAGIDRVRPAAELDWASHTASHPERVYAATGDRGEQLAWDQATMAGSRRLGEHVEEHMAMPSIEESPNPTVYDVTVRGDVDSDPEYDRLRGRLEAVRGNFADVNAEISMPPGSQGTLLPDYYGRNESFAEGFRGQVIGEDTGNVMSGARFERLPYSRVNTDEVLHGPREEQHTLADNSKIPGEQMTRRAWDSGVEAVAGSQMLFDEAAPAMKDAARREQRNPRLFPLSNVQQHTNFPYGVPGGWHDRRAAFVAENDKPIRGQR